MFNKKNDSNVFNFHSPSNPLEIPRVEKEKDYEKPELIQRYLQYTKGTKLIHPILAYKCKLEIYKSIKENEAIAISILEIIEGVEYYIKGENVINSEILKQDILIKEYISKLSRNINFIINIIKKYNIRSKDSEVEKELSHLSYIKHYLAINLIFNDMISEHSEFISEHLSRIKSYLSELISSSQKACEGVISEINSRVPGGGNDNLLLDRDKYTY